MATASTTRLNLEINSPVVRVTLNNPPLNIIDLPMMLEFQQALGELESRPDIAVIVFEGDARAFSAGVDVKAQDRKSVV